MLKSATVGEPSQWQGLKPALRAPLTWLLTVASGSQAEQKVVLPKAVLKRLSGYFGIKFLKLNEELRAGWKYYLDEAEQEPEVQAQLAEIRKEYAALKPENILAIENCTTSLIRIQAA